MSRLTGTDVLGLFEAYQAVYVPQELTEEQVWEEVDTWVNSLIEEGYDLSDYTWEEMYEEYLRESPHLKEFFGPGMDKARKDQKPKPETIDLKPQKGVTAGGTVTLGKGYEATLGGKKGALSYERGSNGGFNRKFREYGSEVNPPSAADAKKSEADPRRNQADPLTKPAAGSPPLRTAAGSPPPRPASASGPVLSKKGGVEGTGVGADFKEKAFTAADKSRYASVAAKNAAVSSGGTPLATSKPTAASQLSPGGRASNSDLGGKTFPKQKTAGGTEYEVRTPTRAEMEASRKAGGGEAGVKSAVERSSKLMGGPEGPGEIKPDPALKSITKSFSPKPKPTPTPAATAPSPVNRSTGSKKPGSIVSGFDMFDVVKGYLIGEGYADTEESALAIMANMSEEWKQSIVEAPGEWFGGLRDKSRASRAAQIQSLQPTPKPLPSNPSPFAKPASKDDSGRLTTYGAGGGAAAERKGQTTAQVMQQGAANRENKNRNPGPNFGR